MTKREAEAALQQLRREIFLDENRLRLPESPIARDWATEYLAWYSLQYPSSIYRTRQVIEQHVLPDWECKRLDEVTDEDIERKVCEWRDAGYRDQTIVKHLHVIAAFFNRAISKGRLGKSPAATVKLPRILDSAPHLFFETNELEAIYLASCFDPWHPDSPQHADWHAPAWKFLANTGCRRGEAFALRRNSIRSNVLLVRSSSEVVDGHRHRTKSGKFREIPLGPGAFEAIDALDLALGDRDYLLPRVTLTSLSRAAAKCIARADLHGSIHTFRHTFISHLAMNPTISVRDIQLWAGHSSLAVTEKYMYLRATSSIELNL